MGYSLIGEILIDHNLIVKIKFSSGVIIFDETSLFPTKTSSNYSSLPLNPLTINLELPVKNEKDDLKGTIYCLVDTDQTGHKTYISDEHKNLKIRRLSNKNSNVGTELLCLNNSDNSICDIEQSLNPIIF